MDTLQQPKTKRQRAILSLIAARPVHSQDELAALLEQQGYEVTQATVSRDIKELGLLKVALKGGARRHVQVRRADASDRRSRRGCTASSRKS